MFIATSFTLKTFHGALISLSFQDLFQISKKIQVTAHWEIKYQKVFFFFFSLLDIGNFFIFYPPTSKAGRHEANPHTPVYGVKEFVCLPLCLSVTNFDPNYLMTSKNRIGAKKILGIFYKKLFLKILYLSYKYQNSSLVGIKDGA